MKSRVWQQLSGTEWLLSEELIQKEVASAYEHSVQQNVERVEGLACVDVVHWVASGHEQVMVLLPMVQMRRLVDRNLQTLKALASALALFLLPVPYLWHSQQPFLHSPDQPLEHLAVGRQDRRLDYCLPLLVLLWRHRHWLLPVYHQHADG